MAGVGDITASIPEATTWRALRYFNLYRLVLSGLFTALVLTNTLPPPFGQDNRGLFTVAVLGYLCAAVVMQVFMEQRYLGRLSLIYAQVLLDIGAITTMMFASGGVASGLGILLIITVIGGSILTAGRHALAFAALSAIAIISEEAYAAFVYRTTAVSYTQAGLLGAVFFAAAILAYFSARRLRESEALAHQRAAAIANLERLNVSIVQRMRSGIVALDAQNRVRVMNASAARLLGTAPDAEGRTLNELLPELARRFETWRREGRNAAMPVHGSAGDVTVAFSALGADDRQGTLIFLEDDAMLRQRAQQLKLASLGKLVASIAHEIRNPLGAISHAAQLLGENEAQLVEDRRLTEIIRDHSQRVNAIVENVMNLARRDVTIAESFELRPWLEEFAIELRARYDLDAGAIALRVQPADLTVRMDGSQLQQVLWNLCENALRYSKGSPLIELRAGIDPGSGRPFLDIIDHGGGIAPEFVERIFEPFATTEATGTGLGLYIANELCEANQATLRLESNSAKGCWFRINFAHPGRLQLTEV
jgi:two-component system sensor histidine kinase PilS (NtrC family)